MAEWFKAAVLKTAFRFPERGFESLSLRQEQTFFGIAVRMGSFFFGCAEREPDVFRGEMGAGARLEPRFFWLFAIGGFLVK